MNGDLIKKKLKTWGLDALFILIACALGAFSTIHILIPNGLSSGGVTGICRIIQETTGISFSLLYYVFVFLILIVCAILLGLGEARKILLLSLVFPTFLFIFEQFNINLLEEKDLILAAIYCGVFTGISIGLLFTRGYSMGGTDTIAKIIQLKLLPHVGISKILLIVDGIIIVTSGLFFGRNIALYALVTQIIFSRVVEYVMYGFETKVVQVEIITEKYDQVVNFILHEIKRGVSNVTVIGEYTQTPRRKIITLCSPRESMLIKQYVAKEDENAFVTVIRVETVWGAGKGFIGLAEEKKK